MEILGKKKGKKEKEIQRIFYPFDFYFEIKNKKEIHEDIHKLDNLHHMSTRDKFSCRAGEKTD